MSAAAQRSWSLSVRLGWRLAAVMLSAILLAAGGMAWRAIATVHELDDSALQNQVRLVAASLPPRAGTGRLILPEELVAPFRASDGDNVFLVYAGDRVAASSDPGAAALLAPLLHVPLLPGFFRLAAMPGHGHGMVGLVAEIGPWEVVLLQGREQTQVLLDSLMGNFLLGAVWLLLPLGAATIVVAVLTLRRGLLPVRRASTAAAVVGPGRPGARLPGAGLPAEVAPLVDAVNDALSRMESALSAQRRFMAEAAHALRTPLAVLTARLDVLDGRPELDGLRHDADRMGRLVGQLLGMARLEGLPLDVRQRVDLRAAAAEAIGALAPLAIRNGVELALLEGPSPPAVPGNHAALVLAITNLIENALGFAPAGSAVEVAVTPPASVTVLDRGPGVPAEYRSRIFERFERGPAPRDGGAGLGLGIVASIAAAHRGAVEVVERAGGGAAFRLALAAPPPMPRPPLPRPLASAPPAAARRPPAPAPAPAPAPDPRTLSSPAGASR